MWTKAVQKEESGIPADEAKFLSRDKIRFVVVQEYSSDLYVFFIIIIYLFIHFKKYIGANIKSRTY